MRATPVPPPGVVGVEVRGVLAGVPVGVSRPLAGGFFAAMEDMVGPNLDGLSRGTNVECRGSLMLGRADVVVRGNGCCSSRYPGLI